MRLSNILAASVFCAGLAIAPVTAGPALAAPPPASNASDDAAIEPGALDALERMSSYLRTLQGFEMRAELTTDEVMDDGRKVQIGSSATYKVRRPDRFSLEMNSDRKVRKVFYDGKTLTLYAPRNHFYAQVPAPATIHQTLDALADRGVEVPLEDLFRWGQPGDNRELIVSAFYVGPARLNGVETDQYAYSSDDLDWQVWIERGPKPTPRKIVITSVFDDAEPQFSAELTWNPTATFSDAEFAFTPPADAKPITFAATQSPAR
jgi:hypothetical protein